MAAGSGAASPATAVAPRQPGLGTSSAGGSGTPPHAASIPTIARQRKRLMLLILLEALLALVLLVLIVWWTMFSGRKKGEPVGKDAGKVESAGLQAAQHVRQLDRRLHFHLVEHARAVHFHRAHADDRADRRSACWAGPRPPAASRRVRARSVRPCAPAAGPSRAGPRAPAAIALIACSTRSTSALSENGFSQKSKAPRLTISTAVGTSAWPVRKITGIASTRPR